MGMCSSGFGPFSASPSSRYSLSSTSSTKSFKSFAEFATQAFQSSGCRSESDLCSSDPNFDFDSDWTSLVGSGSHVVIPSSRFNNPKARFSTNGLPISSPFPSSIIHPPSSTSIIHRPSSILHHPHPSSIIHLL